MAKDLTQIDGVAVVARDTARMANPNLGLTGTVPITTVHEVLLENRDTAIFQCMHPNGPDCTYTADTVRSVTAHQRMHSDRKLLQEELARRAASTERRRAGAIKAAETRAAKKTKQNGASQHSPENTEDDYTRRAALDEYDRGSDMIIEGMRVCQSALDNLAGLPLLDPAIVEKARKWDALRANLQD